MNSRWLVLLVLALLAAACSSVPSPPQRLADATAMASARGWQANVIATQTFQLASWQPSRFVPSQQHLVVYIEGDGLAWVSPTKPSADPTPVNPVALKLALAQQQGNAVYVARPCQFLVGRDPNCRPFFWLNGRFAPEVIAAMNSALDSVKRRFQASELVVVGYSGGAAVAALLAQQRDDIAALVTVAGNIDHRAWTSHHRMTPLDGSLDPLQHAARLAALPQWHFVGGRDRVVPSRPTYRFAAAMHSAQVIVIDEFGHGCCWHQRWAEQWHRVSSALQQNR
jgi:pimeloyl-ACP methyl ester carboxylesterase